MAEEIGLDKMPGYIGKDQSGGASIDGPKPQLAQTIRNSRSGRRGVCKPDRESMKTIVQHIGILQNFDLFRSNVVQYRDANKKDRQA